jgi:atypical dual specificity phosphatase
MAAGGVTRGRLLGSALLVLRDGEPVPINGLGARGRLWIGSVGAAQSRAALERAGITHVVVAARGLAPAFTGDGIEYLVLELEDKPGEDLLGRLDLAVAFIERALAQSEGNRVLVHCFQGKSRSAAVCAAYLMAKSGCSLEEALDEVRRTRPQAQPNLGFAAQLRQYRKRLDAQGGVQRNCG